MQCYHLENGGENAGEIRQGGGGEEGRKQSARSLGRRWETEETSVLDWLSGGEAAKGERQGALRRAQKREKLSLKCPVPSERSLPAKRVYRQVWPPSFVSNFDN